MRSSALVSLCLLTWTLTTWDQIETSALPEEDPNDKEEPCFCDTDGSAFSVGNSLNTRSDENGCFIHEASYCNPRSDTRRDTCDVLTVFGRCPSETTTIEGELVTGAACPSDMAADRWMEIDCNVCSCDEESRTLRCYGFPCPVNDPPICEVGFELVSVPNIEQPCCGLSACSPMNVCVVDGVVFQPGDPVPKKDEVCEDCHCTYEKDPETSFNRVSCVSILFCNICPAGFRNREVPGTCCGDCVQVACAFQIDDTTTLIKPGDTHHSDDKCTSYTCTKDFQIKEDHVMCPMVECVKGTEETDGCCPKCKSPDN